MDTRPTYVLYTIFIRISTSKQYLLVLSLCSLLKILCYLYFYSHTHTKTFAVSILVQLCSKSFQVGMPKKANPGKKNSSRGSTKVGQILSPTAAAKDQFACVTSVLDWLNQDNFLPGSPQDLPNFHARAAAA